MNDARDLNRFVEAQEGTYETALAELLSGRKRSHWMWFIFPQIAGLGFSTTAKHFGIKDSAEARAYLEHPVLGPRLVKCAEAVMTIDDKSATQIFGNPDDLKLRSSATLFASIQPAGSVFHRVLQKYYGGAPDEMTLQLLERTDSH